MCRGFHSMSPMSSSCGWNGGGDGAPGSGPPSGIGPAGRESRGGPCSSSFGIRQPPTKTTASALILCATPRADDATIGVDGPTSRLRRHALGSASLLAIGFLHVADEQEIRAERWGTGGILRRRRAPTSSDVERSGRLVVSHGQLRSSSQWYRRGATRQGEQSRSRAEHSGATSLKPEIRLQVSDDRIPLSSSIASLRERGSELRYVAQARDESHARVLLRNQWPQHPSAARTASTRRLEPGSAQAEPPIAATAPAAPSMTPAFVSSESAWRMARSSSRRASSEIRSSDGRDSDIAGRYRRGMTVTPELHGCNRRTPLSHSIEHIDLGVRQ